MKHTYFLLLLFASIIYTNAFAQPVIQRQKAAGGKSDDNLYSMYLTKDGGLIAGGSSSSNSSGETQLIQLLIIGW